MLISKELIEVSKLPWFPIAMKELGYEPVRHGRWIDDKVAFYIQCSECGANVKANLYDVFLDCDIRDLHYCPNCGAKMDEVTEDAETN